MTEPVPTVSHMVDGQLVDSSLAPKDRTFRNAWKLEDGAIEVDMVKARNLHRDKLRQLRQPKLDALDVQYQRADEDGDGAKKKEVAQKKKALRDVTADPAIEAAQTPEELKALIPEALQ